VLVNDAERSEDVNGTAPNENGVLANLPRARPQRSSARRLAARETTASRNGSGTALSEKRATAKLASAAAGRATRKPVRRRAVKSARSVAPIGESAASATAKSSAAGAPAKAPAPTTKKPAKRTTAGATRKRVHSAPPQEPAPRQGFECEGDAPTGSVQPPGGVELVASAAELVGELAKAGLSRSERLLKDVVSLLPLS
jgi:hypothetical protein